MESTERLVRTWVASGRDEEVEETVSEISTGKTSLLNVVKALGEYLTSEEDELRTKGVEFLSLVLARCPPEKLNLQSVRVLTSFYCGKLDDTETIIPALKGLATLATLSACSSVEATTIIQALFLHVKMKALIQSVRFHVFSTIDSIMARHREALKSLGSTFVTGYISLAEGEKDPRNLLVAFAIARVILIEFDISAYVESMFNIIFCYFPITFRPPPNDPYGITTDDLRIALRQCLNATPSFGPLAIPVFLEKLAAGSPSSKRDTLQALSACLPVYGAALARVSARKLWNALKLEIFQPIDTPTEEEALKATQELVKTIYSEEEKALETNEDIQGLARDACEECIEILGEPEKSQARPAIKVLCAFMATTPSVSRYTLSQAVPHLLKLYMNPDEIINRAPILLLLADLINAAPDSVVKETSDPTTEMISPLKVFKDEIFGAVSTGLQAVTSRRPALAVIKGLVNTKDLLSGEELAFTVHLVNEVLQADEGESEETSHAVLDVLTTVSALSSRHIQEQTLPLLFSSLPDEAPAREAADERAKCWRVLKALSTLCVHPELFEILVIRLTAKVDIVCLPKNDTQEDKEPTAAYAHALLQTIVDTLLEKIDKAHPDIAKYIDSLVPSLYNLFVYSAFIAGGKDLAATDHRLVGVAGEIIELVTQCLLPSRQEIYANLIFESLYSGNIHIIANGLRKIEPDTLLNVFGDSTPKAQKNMVALFAAGIVPLHKEVRPSVPELGPFLSASLLWSLHQTDNDIQRESIWHMIASIVNKRAEDVSVFLNTMLDSFWPDKIGDTSKTTEERQRATRAWIWISKALLVRSHPLAMRFTDRLFEMFDDESISWDAAKAVGEVAASDTILTRSNHAIVKVLHAQKFVNVILPRIMMGAKDSNSSRIQTAHLVALTTLIRSIPKVAYAHEMPSLIPLLLHGLELPDVNMRANVIDTFLAAAEGDSAEQSLVSSHASTLVSSMLKNSMVEEMPSMRVRIAAVQYLGVLPNIVRYDILHPHKATVIRELGKVVDDPKRAVRKEAVDTRTAWFKYNG